MNAHTAIGEDGAIEGVVAKGLEVVCQQVACIDIDVVGEVGEVLVMDASRQYSVIAIDIIDIAILESYLVVGYLQRIVAQLVGTVQRTYVGPTIEHKFTIEVDGTQRTGELDGAKSVAIDFVDKGGGERVGEIKTGAIGKDVEVDVVALGRYIAIDVGLGIRTVVGNSLNINLFFLFVPVYLRI